MARRRGALATFVQIQREAERQREAAGSSRRQIPA